MEWRTVVLTVLGIGLCFLVIPIRVGPTTSVEDVKLFEAYVARYNKSYRHNPTEYDKRFERFQVSHVVQIKQKIKKIKLFYKYIAL